jgi:hypothetical protein
MDAAYVQATPRDFIEDKRSASTVCKFSAQRPGKANRSPSRAENNE